MSIIDYFYPKITGGTIDQLQEVVGDINTSAEKKSDLREIRERMSALKEAIRSGDFKKAGKLLAEMKLLAREAGYQPNDPLMIMLNSVDPTTLGARTARMSEKELNAWETFFSDFDTTLRTEMDRESDVLGRRQQSLNTMSGMLRLSEQAISDIDARWNNAVKDLIGNLRG